MTSFVRPLAGRGDALKALRAALGAYVRQLREARGLTPREAARALGIGYTALSAIENGRNTIPPARYAAFAEVLGVQPAEFAKRVLGLTDPWAHVMLFHPDPEAATADLNKMLGERINVGRRQRATRDGSPGDA